MEKMKSTGLVSVTKMSGWKAIEKNHAVDPWPNQAVVRKQEGPLCSSDEKTLCLVSAKYPSKTPLKLRGSFFLPFFTPHPHRRII
jgi:hypothetical protein